VTSTPITLPSSDPLEVLVISECFEAGTGAAIESIATELAEVRFHLLWAGDAKSLSFAPFASTERLAPSTLGRVRQVRRLASELGVDLVHAHSSWAGVYARVRSSNVPVVYQPHCFGFANPGRGLASRLLSKGLERLLAPRAAVVVAVSADEARTARRLGLSHERVRVVPNSSSLNREGHALRVGPQPPTVPTVVMIGRLAAQKDPEFFAELSRLSAGRGLPFRFVWIGDGDRHYHHLQVSSGVQVTGWLSRDALAEQLVHAFAYTHTAVGEGFPISILDAAAFRLPIVVRPIAALSDAGLRTCEFPEQFLNQLERWHADDESYRQSRRTTDQLNARSSAEEQARRMREVYASMSSTNRRSLVSPGAKGRALTERQDHC
jgi:glycosyltransferase involved in cell wall biosynthesis